MKQEGRGGGPNDPLQGFEDIFTELYVRNHEQPKYEGDFQNHPLFEPLKKYQTSLTPGNDMLEDDSTSSTEIKKPTFK